MNGERALLSLAISYAHEDEQRVDCLKKHLSSFRRQGLIDLWYDRYIDAGSDFKSEIGKNFNSADIVLLMISSDFIHSDFCYEIEMENALGRSEKGDAIVIPVILRPCNWEELPFGKLMAVPKDGIAISTFENSDEAYLEVVLAVKDAANKLLQKYNATKNTEQKTTPLISPNLAGTTEPEVSIPVTSRTAENHNGILARNTDSVATVQKTLIKKCKERT